MTSLRLHLLGSPHIEVNDVRVELKPRKALALLVYLAVTAEYQSRDTLATLFWPETSQRDARAALRRRLSEVASILGDGWLESTRESVHLARNPHLWIDLAEYRQRLLASQAHTHPPAELCPDCLTSLTEAVALYRGSFLNGFTLRDSPAFDEWQFFQTESMRQSQAATLERLVQWHSAQHDPEAALPFGRAWLALDSLHEPVHRHLMHLYAYLGQRTAALRQYEECQRLLAENLGVEPEEETQALFAALKNNSTANTLATPQRHPIEAYRQELPPSPSSPNIAPPSFVGRTRELSALSTALSSARAGNGQIRFVTGGAGLGKTTLVQQFILQAQAIAEELLVIKGHCNAYTGTGDPYLPFREALVQLTGEAETPRGDDLPTGDQAQRLWAALPLILPALVESAPDLIGTFIPAQSMLARALSLTSPQQPWVKKLAGLNAKAQNTPLDERSLFSQYAATLKTVAVHRPLLFILEDLHWIDLASSGLLFHLCNIVSDSRILIVATYRPDDIAMGRGSQAHPLADMLGEFKRQHGAIWLDLNNQTQQERRHFVEAYIDTQPNQLDTAFRNELLHHTEGHALFTVELLHAMQQRGDLSKNHNGQWIASKQIDWQSLPAKVEGVIEKQLARLGQTARAILRIACVQGESFTAEIIANILQLDMQTIVSHLSQELGHQQRLVTAQEQTWLGQQRLSRYAFRHFLFQNYLYQNLDIAERTYLHEAVGNALETLYSEKNAEYAVQLAHHFHQAGLTQKAVNMLFMAGEQARHLAAHQEAIQHLRRGLHLLQTLPETRLRDQQEIEYLISLGKAFDAAGNVHSNEYERVFLRAHTLCLKLDDTTRLIPILFWQSAMHYARGNYHHLHTLGKEMVQLSQQQKDSASLVQAYLILGTAQQIIGDFNASITNLEQMLALYDPDQHYETVFQLIDINVRVLANAHQAVNRWHLGFPDQAQWHSQEAIRVSTERDHAFSDLMARYMVMSLHEMRLEVSQVRNQLPEIVHLATDHQFTFFLVHAQIYAGWLSIEQGQAAAGVAQLLQALSEIEAINQSRTANYYASLLAKGYLALGQSENGLTVIEDALDRVKQSGEHWYDAELYRLKGELLKIAEAPEATVQECLEQAIAIARNQHAKMWELRATVSLCRLWQAQGNVEAAHARLSELYSWFTEGFDTPDLVDAQTLLTELSSSL